MPVVRPGTKRRWTVLALGVVVAIGLAACALKPGGAPAKASAAPPVPHGLPVPGIPQSVGLQLDALPRWTTPQAWTFLAKSGAGLIRSHLMWAVVQPTTAPPNFSDGGYNAFVQHLTDLHIRLVMELTFCNPAFPSPATAAGRAAFATFAADAAKHFHNDGVIWEI